MTGKLKYVCVVFLVFTFLLLSGCDSSAQNGKNAIPKDIKVKNTPAEKEKAKLLREIDFNYENPEPHYKLGKLYASQGMWTEAENQYSLTLTFDPVHREAQAGQIKSLLQMGDKEKSGILADHYINQASSQALPSFKLALAFQQEQLDNYALTCYQNALRLAPNSAMINRQLGYYYLNKNQPAQAKDYFIRSFSIDSYQPDIARELGKMGVTVSVPRTPRKSSKEVDTMAEQKVK